MWKCKLRLVISQQPRDRFESGLKEYSQNKDCSSLWHSDLFWPSYRTSYMRSNYGYRNCSYFIDDRFARDGNFVLWYLDSQLTDLGRVWSITVKRRTVAQSFTGVNFSLHEQNVTGCQTCVIVTSLSNGLVLFSGEWSYCTMYEFYSVIFRQLVDRFWSCL